MPTPTLAAIDNLKQALAIAEQIQKLEGDLKSILNGSSISSAPSFATASPARKKGKRTMSPETIAKMKAAQQARWAKKKGTTPATPKAEAKPAVAPKKKWTMSPEARAKIAAAAKARWAAKKAAAK